MRYYAISITNPDNNEVLLRYSSLNADGSNNLSCLRVVMDIPQYAAGQPAGLAYIKLYGVTFPELSQSNKLTRAKIIVWGGMSKGLPLVNTQQQGILLSGRIWQAFGNWQANEVTLDLVVEPEFSTNIDNANLTGIWAIGENLTSFTKRTLLQAFPSSTVIGKFYAGLTTVSDLSIGHTDLKNFSEQILEISKSINSNADYIGAQIVPTSNGFYLYDGTSAPQAKELAFTDFIGNITYIDYQTINFKTVMRGDLQVGDVIKLPARTNVVNAVNSFTQYRDNISFQNNFTIKSIRHIGDSRQSTADNWCSIIDAYLGG